MIHFPNLWMLLILSSLGCDANLEKKENERDSETKEETSLDGSNGDDIAEQEDGRSENSTSEQDTVLVNADDPIIPKVTENDIVEESALTPLPPITCPEAVLPEWVPEYEYDLNRVPKIDSGGTNYIVALSDESGLTEYQPRPANACGLEGTINERTIDCQCRNGASASAIDSSETPLFSWSLLTRTRKGSEVWRDNLTGNIWSDVINWDVAPEEGAPAESPTWFNWCEASGSSNKLNSPYAEVDPNGICNNSEYQNQESPISACAYDPEFLGGIAEAQDAKGGFGLKQASNTPLVWALPSAEKLWTAWRHGAKWVLPRSFTGLWTSSTRPPLPSSLSDRIDAYRFNSDIARTLERWKLAPVRCVAGGDPRN